MAKGHVSVRVNASGNARVTVNVGTHTKEQAPKLKFGTGNAKLPLACSRSVCPPRMVLSLRTVASLRTDPDNGTREGWSSDRVPVLRRFRRTDPPYRAESRWHNYGLLRGRNAEEMANLILASLSPLASYVRVHVSGDFFSQAYFDAWVEVARQRPRTNVLRIHEGSAVLDRPQGWPSGQFDPDRERRRHARPPYRRARAAIRSCGPLRTGCRRVGAGDRSRR